MLKRSQFAIIDITSLVQQPSSGNANVLWEVRSTLEHLPAAQVVFVVESMANCTLGTTLKQRCLSSLAAAGFEREVTVLQNAHFVEFLVVQDVTKLVAPTGEVVDRYNELTHAIAHCIASRDIGTQSPAPS